MTHRRTILAALAAGGLARPALAQADAFPSRAVVITVPSTPGGTTDVVARLLARALTGPLGRPVVIENVGGAGGGIGTQRAARAEPDGHVLAFGNRGTLLATSILSPALSFDARRDFAPIGRVADVPCMLGASRRSGFRRFADAREAARAQPGRVTMGYSGTGSATHLATVSMLQAAGMEVTLVPYRGGGPAMNDFAAGTLDLCMELTPTMIGAHQGGTAVALAVGHTARLPQVPDVETFAEGGLMEFDGRVWYALLAPARTPPAALRRLGEALEAALGDAELKARLDDLSVPLPAVAERGAGPLADLLAAESERWSSFIRASGMRAE
jgi:tripartite-type tricarboxylate transporter receptor subunit TctC